MKMPWPLQHRADLHQQVVVEIESEQGLDMQELHSGFVRPLQDLLSLATTEPNYVVSLHGRANGERSASEDDLTRPVEVFYAKPFRSVSQKADLLAANMLFTLGDILGSFEKIIPRWLAVWEELRGVCNLFFGIQYN